MRTLVSLSILSMLAVPALAASPAGTLERIRASGTIQVGYRAGAVPFSYTDAQSRVVGYAIDLCRPVIAAIQSELKLANLKVNYVPITSAERLEKVRTGQIDLECATTTNTRDRRQQVAFGLPHYYAAVRLLATTASGARQLADLRDQSIAVVKGTTSERIAAKRVEYGSLKGYVTADTISDARTMLEDGRVSGILYDDVVLALFAQQSGGKFVLVGPKMSVEPLAPMFARNDPTMEALVVRTMSAVYSSGTARTLYDKWFTQPIPPSSTNLRLTISPLLATSFRTPSTRIPEWSEL